MPARFAAISRAGPRWFAGNQPAVFKMGAPGEPTLRRPIQSWGIRYTLRTSFCFRRGAYPTYPNLSWRPAGNSYARPLTDLYAPFGLSWRCCGDSYFPRMGVVVAGQWEIRHFARGPFSQCVSLVRNLIPIAHMLMLYFSAYTTALFVSHWRSLVSPSQFFNHDL